MDTSRPWSSAPAACHAMDLPNDGRASRGAAARERRRVGIWDPRFPSRVVTSLRRCVVKDHAGIGLPRTPSRSCPASRAGRFPRRQNVASGRDDGRQPLGGHGPCEAALQLAGEVSATSRLPRAVCASRPSLVAGRPLSRRKWQIPAREANPGAATAVRLGCTRETRRRLRRAGHRPRRHAGGPCYRPARSAGAPSFPPSERHRR